MFLFYFAAIQSLDKHVRLEYDAALASVPLLVRRETHFMSFLRTDDMDFAKGARRLATYWKYRRQIFQDRWLLPMVQTGKGALSAQDIEVLRTGYSAVFSRPTQGMLVVYNRSRLKHFDADIHMRNVMYICTVFTDKVAQTRGGGCVYVVQSAMALAPDISPAMWEMFRAALPLKLPRQFAIVQAYEGEGKKRLLDFLAYQQARTTEFRSRRRPERLVGYSFRHTLELCEQKGIERQYLPACLGGDYRYSQFDEWIRRRIAIENMQWSAPVDPNHRITTSLLSMPLQTRNGGKRKTAILPRKRKSPYSSAASTDDESRKQNAIYAKKAYYKRKLQVMELEEKVKGLYKQNQRLDAETKRLQGLLCQARAMAQNSKTHRYF